jgi:hypothetical protein
MLVGNNMLDHAGAQAITHHTTQHSKSQCTSNTTSCNSAQQVSVQDTIHTANSVRAPSRWDLYCNRKPLHMRMQEYLREKKGPGSWVMERHLQILRKKPASRTVHPWTRTHTQTHTCTETQTQSMDHSSESLMHRHGKHRQAIRCLV